MPKCPEEILAAFQGGPSEKVRPGEVACGVEQRLDSLEDAPLRKVWNELAEEWLARVEQLGIENRDSTPDGPARTNDSSSWATPDATPIRAIPSITRAARSEEGMVSYA